MTYIPEYRRHALDDRRLLPNTTADLSYMLLSELMSEHGRAEMNGRIELALQAYRCQRLPSFALMTDILGAMEAAELEMLGKPYRSASLLAIQNARQDFYESTVRPYLAVKQTANGDIG